MPRQGLSRDAVITAAIKLANKKGYGELTLGNLARELDIKPPSLYKHVASLEDLQDALGVVAAGALNVALRPTLVMRDPKSAMQGACEIYRDFARQKPGLYGALQPAMARRSEPFQQAAGELLKTIFSLVSALGVQQKNLVHAVRTLRSLLHGFVELEQIGGFGMPEDIEASFRFEIEVFISGVRR